MTDYDQRSLPENHTNPKYDQDEDGTVEQIPPVTDLSEGVMGSGDFLKFDGSKLTGGVVETSDLQWQEDSNSPFTGSSTTEVNCDLSSSYDMVKAVIVVDNQESSQVNGELEVNGVTSGYEQLYYDAEITGRSNFADIYRTYNGETAIVSVKLVKGGLDSNSTGGIMIGHEAGSHVSGLSNQPLHGVCSDANGQISSLKILQGNACDLEIRVYGWNN